MLELTNGSAERMRAVRARQREKFGGVNWGAAFFGWLVAVGLGALLVGLLAALGAAVGLTTLSDTEAAGNASELGVGGAIGLLAALAIAYYCGGYVAGRMSRFDGARPGVGAWLLGLIVTAILAIAGGLLGAEYSELAPAGALALALVVMITLLAALVGGKAGETYHRRVDRAGFME